LEKIGAQGRKTGQVILQASGRENGKEVKPVNKEKLKRLVAKKKKKKNGHSPGGFWLWEVRLRF